MSRKKIYRAGVIPFVKEGDEVRMMFMKPSKPKYGGDTFQIAKGKQEEGEDIKDTALREAKEELGLFEGNIKQLDKVGEFLGRTSVYIAHIKDKTMFGDPHFETGEIAWLTEDEFMDVGRDLHKPVVKAAYRKITKALQEGFLGQLNQDLHQCNIQPSNTPTPIYYTSDWYNIIAEAPQQIGDVSFELNDTETNKQEADRVLNDSNKKVISRQGDFTLFQSDDSVILINEKTKEIVYMVSFVVTHFPQLDSTALTQFKVWRNKNVPESQGLAKLVFDQLLALYDTIITDSEHTQDGERFWLNRIVDAFRADQNVYFINLNDSSTLQQANNYKEMRSLLRTHKVWGVSDQHSQMRMIITNKTLSNEKDHTKYNE